MPKVKIPRKSVAIDMTPMVDMAFLLVTFFILTAAFKPDEPVTVVKPASETAKSIEPDIRIEITVSDDGRVFFDMSNKGNRAQLIKDMGSEYKVTFDSLEVYNFSLLSAFGEPMDSMKAFLDMSPDQRKKIVQPGIPSDSAHNELADWLDFGRHISGSSMIVTLRADQNSNYSVINKVIKTFQDKNATRFELVTDPGGKSEVAKKP
jgi:biopolymer transport protein ExbD